MTHTHLTPETQVADLRSHLRLEHGDPAEHKGATGRALVWEHLRHHPDHVVVDPWDGRLGPKPPS